MFYIRVVKFENAHRRGCRRRRRRRSIVKAHLRNIYTYVGIWAHKIYMYKIYIQTKHT